MIPIISLYPSSIVNKKIQGLENIYRMCILKCYITNGVGLYKYLLLLTPFGTHLREYMTTFSLFPHSFYLFFILITILGGSMILPFLIWFIIIVTIFQLLQLLHLFKLLMSSSRQLRRRRGKKKKKKIPIVFCRMRQRSRASLKKKRMLHFCSPLDGAASLSEQMAEAASSSSLLNRSLCG